MPSFLGFADDAIRPGGPTRRRRPMADPRGWGGFGTGGFGSGGGHTTTGTSKSYGPDDMPASMGRLSGYLDKTLGEYNAEAKRLTGIEESRGAGAEKTITDAAAAADVPTITTADINREFGRSTDASAQGALDQEAALREYMGASGVTGGGLVAGTLASIEASRVAANVAARRDLASFKATQDALDRQRAYDRKKDVAAIQNRPVSLLGMDAMTNTIGARVGQIGAAAEYEGAKASASAAKKAGKNSLIGSVIGAGASLIGSLI